MNNALEVKVIVKDALNEKLNRGESRQWLDVLDPRYYALGLAWPNAKTGVPASAR